PLNLNLGSGRNPTDHLGTVVRGGKSFDTFSDGENGNGSEDVNQMLSQWPHRRLSYPPTPRSGSAHLEQWNSPNHTPLSSSSSPSISNWRMYRDMYGNPMFATCSKCGGKYTNPNVCASHEAKCNGTNRLMCHICKRVYSQMCALKEHLRGKHGLGEMLKCKLCERSFKYKPQLYDHACAGLKKDSGVNARSLVG
ncbi:zinc finger protein, partial [Elysia marginata]